MSSFFICFPKLNSKWLKKLSHFRRKLIYFLAILFSFQILSYSIFFFIFPLATFHTNAFTSSTSNSFHKSNCYKKCLRFKSKNFPMRIFDMPTTSKAFPRWKDKFPYNFLVMTYAIKTECCFSLDVTPFLWCEAKARTEN